MCNIGQAISCSAAFLVRWMEPEGSFLPGGRHRKRSQFIHPPRMWSFHRAVAAARRARLSISSDHNVPRFPDLQPSNVGGTVHLGLTTDVPLTKHMICNHLARRAI